MTSTTTSPIVIRRSLFHRTPAFAVGGHAPSPDYHGRRMVRRSYIIPLAAIALLGVGLRRPQRADRHGRPPPS